MNERQLHQSVFELLQWENPACVWYPVPNFSGNLGPMLGRKFKEQGVRLAGVPDFAFHWKAGSGFIELKAGTNSLSEAQKNFRDKCLEREIPFRVCRSLDQVITTLREWGVLEWEEAA